MREEKISEDLFWIGKQGEVEQLSPLEGLFKAICDMEDWVILSMEDWDVDTQKTTEIRRVYHVHEKEGRREISLKSWSGLIEAPEPCPICDVKPDNLETLHDLWEIGA